MQVDTEVLTVLRHARTVHNNLYLTDGLSRALYLRTNTVIEAVGGKWSRKAKAHVFEQDAQAALMPILLHGQVTIAQDFGYYPTPPDIVARMLKQTALRKWHKVLEPSAGSGAIASQVAALGASVDCVELLDSNIRTLRILQAGGTLNGAVVQADFLAIEPLPMYDRVVMNPPFAKQADIHHVMHALQFLKPIGMLTSIMSAGIKFRDNKLTNTLRTLIQERGGEIEDLPAGAFQSSGTGVHTVLVSIPAA